MAYLRFGFLILCCVVIFTGTNAQLGDKYCDSAVETPSIFLCQSDSRSVAANQALYLDTTGAPDYASVNCTCTITITGSSSVFVTYRSRFYSTCGIQVSLGGQVWGCELSDDYSVFLNANSELNYIKNDSSVDDWYSCFSLRAPNTGLSVECFPSVPLYPTTATSTTSTSTSSTTTTTTTTTTATPTTTDGDQCAPNPCQNGASCTDGDNDFTCNCTAGYEGKTCQTDTDDCASTPCENSGSCTDGANGFTCNCTVGYEGDTCQTDTDDCASTPCDNGGSCIDGVNGFTCNCTAGYEGATCQTDTDDCSSSPCENGASCEDGVNSFFCNCTAGFEGTTCDTDIDECQSSPCLNGANCTNIVNGYTCTCLSGFANANCSEAVDECTSNPCLNGAACTDGSNSYSCSCVTGFEGVNCGTNTNDCTSSSCLNGGTCVDGVNEFTCTCADGFDGDNCENSIGPETGALTVADAGTDWKLIVGIVVGLIVLILIILIIVLLVCRRRRRERRPKKTERSVSYTPSRGDVTVTENALYNYDGENPSEAVNALFIGGIPDTPGTGTDYIPHFKTDTGDRYAVIIDSTRSKPKAKERPSLSSFTEKTKGDDTDNLIRPKLSVPYDTLDSDTGKMTENGDLGMGGVHNPGYEHEYLAPKDSRTMTLTSDKSDTYDYIDQAKLRMDDEVFERENGPYFKIQDGGIDKDADDSGYSNNRMVDESTSSVGRPSVSSPDGGYMNATNGGYANSPPPSGNTPSSTNITTTPSHDGAFTFE